MQDEDIRREFNGKRVMITGGLGFIGSNLARRLLDAGAELLLVDSLIPEYGGNPHNIAEIEAKVRIDTSDVRDHEAMARLIRGQDFLFNLAGQTSHMDSMRDPETDLEINCKAQLSILEACRRHNPAIRIVFASTRQMYGRPDYLPVDEQHLLRPVDVNGINKMAGEWYHILYNNVYGIRACALRLTNTIGPCMRIKDARQTFLGIWVRLLLEGKPFEVWGGDQLRDFNFVADAVDAFCLAATHADAYGRVFNLGASPPISLLNTAKLLAEVAGGAQFVVREFPADRRRIDIGDYYSDYALIRSTLGWEPRTPLREALRKTVDFYRTRLGHYL